MCTAWCARGIKPRTSDANLYWRTLLASMSQHGNTRHGCTTPSCSAFDGHLRLSLHRNLRANGFRSGSSLQEGPWPGLVWPRTPKALAMSASRNARQTKRGLHWLTKLARASVALQKWANPGRSREDQQAGSTRTATLLANTPLSKREAARKPT